MSFTSTSILISNLYCAFDVNLDFFAYNHIIVSSKMDLSLSRPYYLSSVALPLFLRAKNMQRFISFKTSSNLFTLSAAAFVTDLHKNIAEKLACNRYLITLVCVGLPCRWF